MLTILQVLKAKTNNICSNDCSCGGKYKAQHTITVGDIGINGLHNNNRDGTCSLICSLIISLMVHLI